MMRPFKSFFLWTLLFLSFVLQRPVFADDAFTKLGRGLVNVATAPGEIFIQMINMKKSHDPGTAFAGGLFKGIGWMFAREMAGIYEVVTFPIPLPRDYRPLWHPAEVPETVPEAFFRIYPSDKE